MLLQGSAMLFQQFGSKVGLDDVSVESDINNDTSLVLGRYLSPRLYVSYGVSLVESINTIKARYTHRRSLDDPDRGRHQPERRPGLHYRALAAQNFLDAAVGHQPDDRDHARSSMPASHGHANATPIAAR